MASRALDFGAEAVIAPMVNSLEDARRFAAAMKYPPVGERSWGPTYGFPRHGQGTHADWLRDSNARTISFAMIETRAAVDVLDGILDTPGIDGIFLGPSDFSIAWSGGATVNPSLEDMMQTVERDRRPRPQGGQIRGDLRRRPGNCRPLRIDGLPGSRARLRTRADEARRRHAAQGRALLGEVISRAGSK